MANEIKIEDVGQLKDFVGYKIKIGKSEQSAKFTQPVKIQSFLDEYGSGKKKYLNSKKYYIFSTNIFFKKIFIWVKQYDFDTVTIKTSHF